MDAIVIATALIIVTFFLAKPKSPPRKSKKFGEGLFTGKADNFGRYDSYF